MTLYDQIKELKAEGKTVTEIAKTLGKPIWLVRAFYFLA
jgi:hypothetical protein